jgi:hypothetical protein
VFRHVSDLQFRRHRWLAVVPTAPLERWGILAGEVLFSLRATLDSLVYAAAVSVLGQDPPPFAESLAFPIEMSRKKYEDKARRALKPFIGHPSSDLISVLEQLQPYHDGHGGTFDEERAQVEGLGLLRDLHNNDKHRIPHAVTFSFPRSAPTFDRFNGVATNFQFSLGRAEDGGQAAAVETSVGSPSIRATFHDPVEVTLLSMPYDLATNLWGLHELVGDIVATVACEVWPN